MGTWTVVNDALVSGRTDFNAWGWEQSAIGISGGYGTTPYYNTNSEEYDGTSFSMGGNILGTRIRGKGAGTLTAGFINGGMIQGGQPSLTTTEEYDGASWSAANNMLQARAFHASTGRSQNAGLTWGGSGATVGEYDGTSWSAANDTIPSYRTYTKVGGSGTQSYTLSVGNGSSNPLGNKYVLSYDGVSWTSETQTTNAKRDTTVGGDPGSAIAAGASHDINASTEEWNGTSWAAESSLNYGRGHVHNQAGTHEDAIVIAPGATAGQQNEEWDDVPICWNYTAKYSDSNKLFKMSGPGVYPKYLNVPGNVDTNTGKMIDDGKEIDPSLYRTKRDT